MKNLEEFKDVLISLGCYEKLMITINDGNRNTEDGYETTLDMSISPLILWANTEEGYEYWEDICYKVEEKCKYLASTYYTVLEIREFLLNSGNDLTSITYRSLYE